MSVVELLPYDLLTADAGRIMAPLGFWAALPRLTRTSSARLLLVADNLEPQTVLAGFQEVAVPLEELPPRMAAYRLHYEEFLPQVVQRTRVMKAYLVTDSLLGEESLLRVLATYGLRARSLPPGGVPLPFLKGTLAWNRLHTPDGMHWAVVRSALGQSGQYLPTALHRLFGLDFPIWAAIDIYTYPTSEATRLLRSKDSSARYERSQAGEAQAEALAVRASVQQLREEMNRTGSALHTTRLAVLVGAASEGRLRERLEVVRGASGIELEGWESEAGHIQSMFSAAAPTTSEGSLHSSLGLSILAGSALSYRRRTETRGILLGTDRHQAPVILDLFDVRHPSYNLVVLGLPGAGKTLSVLLLATRYLMLGKRMIIIDPQGNVDLSWLGDDLCHRVALGTPEASINILDMVYEELATQVEMVTAKLGMLGVLSPRDRSERAVLDQVLVDIYRPLWGRTTSAPTLRAVQSRLEALAEDSPLPEICEKAALLAYALTPYVQGSRAELFGRATTVDLSLQHPVTIFDVSRLPRTGSGDGANLRTALLAILVAGIQQGIRTQRLAGDLVETLFFIDEIGVLMRDEVIAAYVSEQFKTARSRGVAMIAIDQELNSLLGTTDRRGLSHGAMMLATAATVLLFQQKAAELGRMRAAFPDLPEALLATLPQLPRGSCIAQLPDDLLLVNVLPSPFEHALLSSRLQDRARAQQLMAQIEAEIAALQGAPAPVT